MRKPKLVDCPRCGGLAAKGYTPGTYVCDSCGLSCYGNGMPVFGYVNDPITGGTLLDDDDDDLVDDMVESLVDLYDDIGDEPLPIPRTFQIQSVLSSE